MPFPLPTLLAEVAFTTGPGQTPVYVDLTSRLRGFSISRGRQYALGRYEAGTARVKFDNRDRGLDPTYAGTVVNLITNPSVETNTTGYGTNLASIARNSSAAYQGGFGIVLTLTNVNFSQVMWQKANLTGLIPGKAYTFSVWARRATGGSTTMRLRIDWHSGGTVLFDSIAVIVLSNVWTRYSVSAAAPATADRADLTLTTQTSPQGVLDIWTDAWQFEVGDETIQNLITNPSTETNSTGYTGNNGTLTRQTGAGNAHIGFDNLSLATTNVADSGIQYGGPGVLPATPSVTYTASWYARLAVAGSKSMELLIVWLNSGGSLISFEETLLTLNSTTYQRFSVTGTAPGGTVSARIYLMTKVAGGIFTFYADALQFEVGSAATAYFDGDQASSSWTGTAHASTSVFSIPVLTDYIDGSLANGSWTGTAHASTSRRGGKYFGQILPMKKIRLSATYNAITYRLFTGFVDGWPQSWPGNVDGIVEVPCTDGFKVLSLTKVSGIIKAVDLARNNGGGSIRIRSADHRLTNGDVVTISGVQGTTEANGTWAVTNVAADHFDLTSSTFSNAYLSGGTIATYPVQRSDVRITALLDVADWLAADRDLDVGISTVQPALLDNVSVLEHLQAVELSENGRLFMKADGELRFENRHTPYLTTSLFTFTGDHYHSPIVDYDDTQIWNEVTVTRAGEAVLEGRLAPLAPVAQVQEDAASQTDYLIRSLARASEVESDNETHDAAEFLLAQYKDPATRVSSIIVPPARVPDTLWPQVLGREIGERVTVTIEPPGGGDPISQESFIEGLDLDYAAEPRHFDAVYRLSAIGIAYLLYPSGKSIFTVETSALTSGTGVLVY